MWITYSAPRWRCSSCKSCPMWITYWAHRWRCSSCKSCTCESHTEHRWSCSKSLSWKTPPALNEEIEQYILLELELASAGSREVPNRIWTWKNCKLIARCVSFVKHRNYASFFYFHTFHAALETNESYEIQQQSHTILQSNPLNIARPFLTFGLVQPSTHKELWKLFQ
jgi:hypothetical protein